MPLTRTTPPLFPYTTLFRSMTDRNRSQYALDKIEKAPPAKWVREMRAHFDRTGLYRPRNIRRVMGDQTESVKFDSDPAYGDRKSTRLNSSHANISYAVFCLK